MLITFCVDSLTQCALVLDGKVALYTQQTYVGVGLGLGLGLVGLGLGLVGLAGLGLGL